MTTEAKIREAFEKYSGGYAPEEQEVAYLDFKAGYMAGMAEAFEAAAKSFEDSTQSNVLFTVYQVAAAIRKMAKEKPYTLPDDISDCGIGY